MTGILARKLHPSPIPSSLPLSLLLFPAFTTTTLDRSEHDHPSKASIIGVMGVSMAIDGFYQSAERTIDTDDSVIGVGAHSGV